MLDRGARYVAAKDPHALGVTRGQDFAGTEKMEKYLIAMPGSQLAAVRLNHFTEDTNVLIET